MRFRKRRLNSGICNYCHAEVERSRMAKHLVSCSARRKVIQQAEQKEVAPERLYHLFVEDAWLPEFWLHLEMRGSSTLKELDKYLRAIWLECCNHLSDFHEVMHGKRVKKSLPIQEVFDETDELLHIYDYGTPSETLITVVAVREGKPTTPHPIALMARNCMPNTQCSRCGQPAKWWCSECLAEVDAIVHLCDACREAHYREHTEAIGDDDLSFEEYLEGIFPLVNSPRLGMCGYTGPAEPPY